MNEIRKYFDRMFDIVERIVESQKQIVDKQVMYIQLIEDNKNKINSLYCILSMVVLFNILIIIWSGI